MDKLKIIYTLIIVLLFLPLVFMGANIFFPEYSGSDDYYKGGECYELQDEERIETPEFKECIETEEKERAQYQEAKQAYDSWKYIFVVAVSLLALLIAIFVKLDQSILYGLFLGATLASFFSTWIYFDTQSRLGFLFLVVIFVAAIGFIVSRTKKK